MDVGPSSIAEDAREGGGSVLGRREEADEGDEERDEREREREKKPP